MKHIAVQNFHYGDQAKQGIKGFDIRIGDPVDLDNLPPDVKRDAIEKNLVRLATKEERAVFQVRLEHSGEVVKEEAPLSHSGKHKK